MTYSRSRQTVNVVLTLTLALGIAGFGAALTRADAAVHAAPQATPDEVAQLAASAADLQAVSRAFRTVAKIARPGVVHIRVSGGELGGSHEEERERMREEIRRHFKDMPDEEIDRWLRRAPPGAGSGVILDADGYILTNNHVVEGRDTITVVLSDEHEHTAKITGTDSKTDLAVIKIDAPDLRPLKFGDSDTLEVGDWVVAVGSPFGLEQTVTHGIVSAKGRSGVAGIDIAYQDFIQTDAAINPGNSGGPLLNLRGEVIGVNTAIATRGDAMNAGVAFTIPSNLAAKIAAQLKTGGAVQRGWLGVSLDDLRAEDVEIFGLPGTKGALVSLVVRHSPAERAGLEVEDVVVAVDDNEVVNVKQLRNLIADLRPDQRVRMRVFRDGRERFVTARLGLQPADTRRTVGEPSTTAREIPRLGMQFRTLRPDMIRQLSLPYNESARGVLLMEFAKGEEHPDIGPRQLLVSCNGQSVKSVGELLEVLKDVPKNESVTLGFLEATGDQTFVEIKPRR